MKKLLLALSLVVFSTTTFAATKCERNVDGSVCCWDTVRDGPFKPLGC